MSSDPDSAAAIADIINHLYTEEYCDIAASILFSYEVLVTFDREVACFWTASKRGLASLLFLANKWITVTVSVLTLAQFASFPSDQRFVVIQSSINCSSFSVAGTAMSILQYVPGAVFSALRGYVLSRSKLLGIVILVLSLAPVGANLHISYKVPIVVLSSRVPLIVADILLIYVTWTKLSSRDTFNDMRRSKRLSLSDVLLRDGTIYFVALFILNVLHLILSATALGIGADGGSYVTTFTAPITAILISRFLLELQEADQTVVRLDADDPLHSSRDLYDDRPSFISSLGAFINPDLPVPRDNDSELFAYSRSDPEEECRAQVSESQTAASLSSA
ncbi:hypothetical protein OH76DRAFT_1481581 [Lentinus brumalis]|uniref:DUF6533 domain-containing protein n=1 Tax=Lentinus brumalis TaxID=2498619 RepID=A0A371DFJ4_9APHY|nr:hypothetical protein OH76DRAFT_1481581 [Polyporus brumalis]